MNYQNFAKCSIVQIGNHGEIQDHVRLLMLGIIQLLYLEV